MNGIRRRNLGILGILCAFFLFFAIGGGRLDIPCPFKNITSLPCPGCGGMRAAGSLFHGDLSGALKTNPLSVLVIVFIAVSAAWLFADLICGRDTYWEIFRMRWSRTAVIISVAVILANWAWNICKEL